MKSTNRLAVEASPYLQQHAHNPVDWYAWGDEALAAAKRDDKPILLSIGYSACHWCHVMERESFEDPDIAALMNELFVNVKVDREERPDLDQIYQLVVQLMGRSGGWPLTVFLTPDQKPFFGGTYFPPVDRYGVSGFPKVLRAIAEAYAERRGEVAEQADEITRAIAEATGPRAGSGDFALGPDLLARAAKGIAPRFDDVHGGFGRRPKFPNTFGLDVLLRRGALEGDQTALARAKKALDAMRAGGIYDHLGGGFHRYSTDEAWLVPHFEKMLYDNALLLRSYTDGARAFADPGHAETARGIALYLAREMTSKEGGFFATQDADSEGVEGRFFVWSKAEIEDALAGDEDALRVAIAHLGVTARGNFEESGNSVLYAAEPLDAIASRDGAPREEVEAAFSRARSRLSAVRESRVKPFRDEKIIASWNGLAIGALAEAGAALRDDAALAMAERAYAFVARALVQGGRVARHVKDGVVKGPGFLDDHAFVASAALDLYEATGKPEYVESARVIADVILGRFADAAGGGFFFTADDGEALILRAKDPFDHAIPSGVAVTCHVLLRLGAIADERYHEPARRELERLARSAVENPLGLGRTVCELDRLVRGSVDVVLVGPRDDARTRALAAAVFAAYLPNRNVAWLDPDDARSVAACAALGDGKVAHAGKAVAYVCRGRTCSLPLTEPSELAGLLREGR